MTLLLLNLAERDVHVNVTSESAFGSFVRAKEDAGHDATRVEWHLGMSFNASISLSGHVGLLGTGVRLNGVELELDKPSGRVPSISGKAVRVSRENFGNVSLAARSIAFVVFEGVVCEGA